MNVGVTASKPKQIAGLAVSLSLTACVAATGRLFTNLSVEDWYPTLIKPSWTPSGSTIGLVWMIIYTSMAVAAWLVWRRGGVLAERLPLGIYSMQLLLNAGWSAIFFGVRSPGLALLEIVGLWIMILTTSVTFWRVSKLAGALMIPYLTWAAFALVLNLWIWRLN